MRLRARTLYILVVVAALAVSGCGDNVIADDGGSTDTGSETETDTGSETDTGDTGGEQPIRWTVDVDLATGAWSATPPDGEAPVISGDAWANLIVGGAPEIVYLFGAFQFDLSTATWAGIAGEEPTVVTDADAGMTEVWWPLDGADGMVGIRFEQLGDGYLRVALVSDLEVPVTGGSLRVDSSPEDSWFGLGDQTVGLDLAGRVYPLWTQEQGIGKPEEDGFFPVQNVPEAAYAPMGVWHTTGGWSAVLDVDAYTELDLTDGDHAVVRTVGQLPSFVVVAGATPRDRVVGVTNIVGRIEPPAPWVFGPWNDAVGGPDRLHEVAGKLRDEGIPSSAIWSEDWIGGEEGPSGFRLSYAWIWDPEHYPDLPEDIEALHADGFAFLAYFNPFIVSTTPMWDEALAGGFGIADPTGEIYTFTDPAGRDASLVDLTNPAAVAWLQGYLEDAASELEIDGWMADFAEWMPHDAMLDSGVDPLIHHNRYPLIWQQTNYDAMTAVHGGGPATDEGWVFFARSGWASTWGASAARTPTLWGGDQNTDWGRDDGLPSVIPMATHVGLSGVPIFGTDIAGYSSFTVEPTDKELFYRWTSLAAFHPLMRTHHGSSECANWAFDRDAETLDHYRRWTRVHTLLYPVWRQLAEEAVGTGLPITRHPWLVAPDTPTLWGPEGDAFFIGDDLLVAPVVVQGATARDVDLPGPGWWPLFGDGPLSETLHNAEAQMTEIPVFARPGTILPLLIEPVDSHYGSTTEGVTDLDDVAGQFRLALYPAGGGALEPLDVDGTSISGSLTPGTDLSDATVDGAAVPLCGDAPSEVCAIGQTLHLVAASATIAVGDDTLTLTGEATRTWRIGLGGAAWAELAEPTEIGDPDPDIPPPCE